jgi:hypothetical protein
LKVGFAVVVSTPSIISVKEARKLLGKDYRTLTNEQIEEIVTLLNVVALDFIQSTVPK